MDSIDRWREAPSTVAMAAVLLLTVTAAFAGTAAAQDGTTTPSCIISDDTVKVSENVNVDASGAGAEGDVEIRKRSGASWENLGGSQGVITYSRTGTFNPEIRYKTRLGQQSWETSQCGSVTVVSNQQVTPGFSYSPSSPKPNQAVTFTSQTHPSSMVTQTQWIFREGQNRMSTKMGKQATYSFNSPGTYQVEMKVTTTNGNTMTTTKMVNVQEKQNPKASFSYSPGKPTVGQSVSFVSHSSGPGGIDSQNWKIDGDSVHEGSEFTHTFNQQGSHVVNLTVESGSGESDSTVQTVDVQSKQNNNNGSNSSGGGGQGQPGFGVVVFLTALAAVSIATLKKR